MLPNRTQNSKNIAQNPFRNSREAAAETVKKLCKSRWKTLENLYKSQENPTQEQTRGEQTQSCYVVLLTRALRDAARGYTPWKH